MPKSENDTLTNDERELLAHIEWVAGVWYPHAALSKLFRLGYVEAILTPFHGCFCAEVFTTRQGTAIVNRLH